MPNVQHSFSIISNNLILIYLTRTRQHKLNTRTNQTWKIISYHLIISNNLIISSTEQDNINLTLEALKKGHINASLIDNYVLTSYHKFVKDEEVRIETTYQQPITYGVVLRNNATNMEQCFRSYMRNHPQEVFEVIAKNLAPLEVGLFLRSSASMDISPMIGFCTVIVIVQ